MAQALNTLIQPQEVVNGGIMKASPMNNSMDKSLISSHIMDAELKYVVEALGLTFYNKLIELKGGTLSNYNSRLGTVSPGFTEEALEELWKLHLMQLTAIAVTMEAIPFIAVQIGANGVFTASTEHAQPVSKSMIQFQQDRLHSKLILRIKTMKTFLCENSENYTPFGFDPISCPGESSCGSEDKVDDVNEFGIDLY